jgi:pimeloyl-ACP methyl ester carboxylesterase
MILDDIDIGQDTLAGEEDILIETPSVRLAGRVLGLVGAEPVILIPGLGMQLVDWPSGLIEALAARYQVVLLDNRDCGRSARFGPRFEKDALARGVRLFAGCADSASYALADMAGDVISLMDRLDLKACHLIGFSMGGMIAQIVAAAYPERTLSLVSLMSSGGEAWIDCTSEAREAMLRSMAGFTTRDHAIADSVAAARLYGVRAATADGAVLAAAAARSFARAYLPGGVLRQALAMRASGERSAFLKGIRAPTTVIHGRQDVCIAFHQGTRAAELIPGARFVPIDDAGHDVADVDPALVIGCLAEARLAD